MVEFLFLAVLFCFRVCVTNYAVCVSNYFGMRRGAVPRVETTLDPRLSLGFSGLGSRAQNTSTSSMILPSNTTATSRSWRPNRRTSLRIGSASSRAAEPSNAWDGAFIDSGSYPVPPERARFWEAILWPQQRDDDPQAVLSHETALALWGLSDVNPSKIHITLPKTERLRRRPPRVVNLHKANLTKKDVTLHEGLPITTVERTLRDCIDYGEQRFAIEGIKDAWNKKLITASQRKFLERLIERD